MNLRDVLKKFGTENGKNVGINLEVIKVYTKQLFTALNFVHKLKILHTDIKPDM
jgi:serine/threonine protein kinase